jgi:PiT family inorganic phosphate transporter
MSGSLLLVLAAGAFVAYVNGANDVSKGIATLVGSGVTSYRRAMLWGTAWTAVGGIAAVAWGAAIGNTFGNGLLAPGTSATFLAAIATIAGAALWVLIATRRGLPVSTTHAIVGSLTGVAAFAYGVDGIRWGAVGAKVLLPLLLSPIAALGLVIVVLRVNRYFAGCATSTDDCLCAGVEPVAAMEPTQQGTTMSAVLVPIGARLRLFTGGTDECAREGDRVLRLGVDHLHWLTSGLTSLARGLSDAPKMAALMMTAAVLGGGAAAPTTAMIVLVTLGMVAGSLIAGGRVTRVLAEDVTPLDHREGFVANLVTSSLVLGGALGGLPMSSTHVSASAIMGAGTQRTPPSINRSVVRQMLLAWVVTLPGAGVLGVASYLVLTAL